MFKIIVPENFNPYEILELAKVFLPQEELEIEIGPKDLSWNSHKREALKQDVYKELSQYTKKSPKWGILTGVRPVKLTGNLVREIGLDNTRKKLLDFYYLHPDKVNLLLDIYNYQQEHIEENHKDVALYIGIPFCPSRCSYCSFTSNQGSQYEMDQYLDALVHEIISVGKLMEKANKVPETIYIGGGTPTALSLEGLERLMKTLDRTFSRDGLKEFTVEAGRPDTISGEKLSVLKDYGVDRISINPQSMNEKTLERIGRSHSPEAIIQAFELAKPFGFQINSDVIAGLPGENPKDFQKTLTTMIDQGPDNITLHTLAVKKASALLLEDKDYHYGAGDNVEEMLAKAHSILPELAYHPYYLYRQKHMAGALENVGYCKEGAMCLYNVRIMDEHQSLVALGAGGISKAYYPEENRLERVPNVANYKIYIERIDEMIERKKNNLFMEEML